LPADPEALRHMAANSDANASLHAHLTDWERRKDELTESHRAAAARLRSTLQAHGANMSQETEVGRAHQEYIEACRQRAQRAQKAARRPDVEAQLVSRCTAEAAQQQDREARIQAEEQLRAVGNEVHCSAANIEEVAGELREWVNTQERLD